MSIDAHQEEQKALQFLQQGRTEQALQSYKRILSHDPKNRRIKKTVADLSLKMGMNKEAENLYLSIVEAMVKEKQHRMAIPIYRDLIKLRPKDHEMHLELADCLLEAKFETDAITHLKKAVDMTHRMKPEIAQEIQQRVIALLPGELQERRRFVELLEAANWSDKASDEWKKFAELNRRLGKPGEAARSIESALNLRENWEVRLDAAQARLDAKEPRKALEHLQKIYKDFPTEPRLLALLATGLQSVHQEVKAKQLWLQAALRYTDPQKQLAAYEQAIVCGATEEELGEAYPNSKLRAEAKLLRLHHQEWAQAKTKAELRYTVKANLLMEYGLFGAALKVLQSAEGMEKRPSIFALYIETLVALGKTEEAILTLQDFHAGNDDIQNDIQKRLLGLGQEEEDSEELIDDDLLDDDLDDLDDDLDNDLDNDLEEFEGSQDSSQDLLSMAQNIYDTGEVNAAMDVLNQLLESDPSNTDAAMLLGKWMMELPSDSSELGSMEKNPANAFHDSFESMSGHSSGFGMQTDFASFSSGNQASSFSDFGSTEMPFDFGQASSQPSDAAVSTFSTSHSQTMKSEGLSGELREAKIRLLVGLYAEAESLLENQNGLQAAILLSQAKRAQENFRSATSTLQNALDSGDRSDPLFLDALWELATVYALQQRVRPAQHTLDEIQDLDPNFRYEELNLFRQGLNLLK